MSDVQRCEWAETNELFLPYHDDEWGTPQHNERHLFEMLTLEGAQAGLSWLTILKRREGYRKAFARFDATKVARFDDNDILTLLNNPEIIRNKLKVNGTVKNAKAYLAMQQRHGSFDTYLWSFVSGVPIPYDRRDEALEISEKMSKQFKKDGFTFVGQTICFALMQATGMVNDHEPGCYLHVTQRGAQKTPQSHA